MNGANITNESYLECHRNSNWNLMTAMLLKE